MNISQRFLNMSDLPDFVKEIGRMPRLLRMRLSMKHQVDDSPVEVRTKKEIEGTSYCLKNW